MSANNGVIRIGRKGIKKFAFGEEGEPFSVDVVVAFQEWIRLDESFRQTDGDQKGTILTEDIPAYHQEAVKFVCGLASVNDSDGQGRSHPSITTAEALDFIARLNEQYNELADFFRPKRRQEEESHDTSVADLRFSVEPDTSPTSTN